MIPLSTPKALTSSLLAIHSFFCLSLFFLAPSLCPLHFVLVSFICISPFHFFRLFDHKFHQETVLKDLKEEIGEDEIVVDGFPGIKVQCGKTSCIFEFITYKYKGKVKKEEAGTNRDQLESEQPMPDNDLQRKQVSRSQSVPTPYQIDIEGGAEGRGRGRWLQPGDDVNRPAWNENQRGVPRSGPGVRHGVAGMCETFRMSQSSRGRIRNGSGSSVSPLLESMSETDEASSLGGSFDKPDLDSCVSTTDGQ